MSIWIVPFFLRRIGRIVYDIVAEASLLTVYSIVVVIVVVVLPFF